jgi:hypothetical protein
MKNRNKILLLGILISLGFFIRVWGIGYGLPYLSHPDETRVIFDTLSMGHRLSLLPARPDYSLLYRYLLLFLYGVYFVLGKLAGTFKNSMDFAYAFMVNPAPVYLITRSVSVIFGTLTGVVAYRLGKRFFSERVGVVALVFTLFEFQLMQHSQWGIYPSAFCFTTLLAMYFIFLALESPSMKHYWSMGVFTGIAIATQNHGIFLLPAVAAVVSITFIPQWKSFNRKVFFYQVSVLTLGVLLFSLMGNFYWLFIFKKAAMKYAELLGVTQVGFASQAPYANNFISMLWWYLKELLRQDGALGFFLAGGIIYAVFLKSRYSVVFLIYVATNVFMFSRWGFRLLHDMLGVMPIVCVFAAVFFVRVFKMARVREGLIYALSCVVALPLIFDTVRVNIKKTHPDTREIARQWIEKHVPVDQKIAIDWHVFSVPLYSKIPLYFRNPVAKKYYDENIPQQLKDKYADFLRDKPVYALVEAMAPLEAPEWPSDMPEDARKLAAQKEVYKDLYSKFRYRSLRDLKRDNAKYLIISSYLYGYFLLNSDQMKKDLFNPFIKDRPWLNFNQADHYIPDNRYGLLFFLSRDARNFYLPLLHQETLEAECIKTFAPDSLHLGPVIKVYKLQ